jgi:putative membrane protein
LKSFLQRWVISTAAALIATYILHGRITYGGPVDLFVATLLLGLLNTFLRPVLMLLSLPILIFTLGLFTFVINGVLLWLVSRLMGESHFYVNGFGTAFWGALIISIVSMLLNSLTGSGNSRVQIRRQKPPEPKRDDGGGPVIDV